MTERLIGANYYNRRARREKFRWAKRMRRRPTPAEAAVWEIVRKRRLGVWFQRQIVILGWIVDFYCPELKLVVEVDGSEDPSKAFKQATLQRRGFEVVRLSNEDVLQSPVRIQSILRSAVRPANES